jgi:hypothetical protein
MLQKRPLPGIHLPGFFLPVDIAPVVRSRGLDGRSAKVRRHRQDIFLAPSGRQRPLRSMVVF